MNIKLLFRYFRSPVTSPISTPKDSVNPSAPLLNNTGIYATDKHASLSTEELFRRHEEAVRGMSNEELSRRYEEAMRGNRENYEGGNITNYEELVSYFRRNYDAVMRDYAGISLRTPANPNVIMNPPTRNSNSVIIGSLDNPNLYISNMRLQADNNVAISANMMGNSPSLNVTPNTNVPISALISEEVRAEREFNRRREEEREFRRREESRRLSNYPNENDRIYSNQEHNRISAVNDLLTGSRNASDRPRNEDNGRRVPWDSWSTSYLSNHLNQRLGQVRNDSSISPYPTEPSTQINDSYLNELKGLTQKIIDLKEEKEKMNEEILKLREQVSKGKNAISDLDVGQ